jgi:hypothetical protein
MGRWVGRWVGIKPPLLGSSKKKPDNRPPTGISMALWVHKHGSQKMKKGNDT